MKLILTDIPPLFSAGLFFLLGLCVGTLLVRWTVRLTDEERLQPPGKEAGISGWSRWLYHIPVAGYLLWRSRGRPRDCHPWASIGAGGLLLEAGTGALFAAFVIAMVRFECQAVPEVRPDEFWRFGRIVYHLVLISLLVTATATDFREYIIPDRITFTGAAVGVLAATLSGDLQMIHLWVDWNREHPVLGPYIPAWIADHPHWHGLAWSTAGLVAGGGMTWLVRAVSSLLLGREALGFGDVTLMAMIGSFVGWQPVVFVFVLAPLCGLVVGLTVRLFSARTFVPYGPYLSGAAIVVLFGWRWIWLLEIEGTDAVGFSTRRLFGDWPSLAILGGVALTALVVLLGLLRMYRLIPVDRRNRAKREPGDP